MNFGQNLLDWFTSQAQSIVVLAIIVIGIFLGMKREITKLVTFLIVAILAVGFVFNPMGVKDVLLELFNRILGT